MRKEYTCELDGLVMHGETDDELVAHVQRHIAEKHADFVGKVLRDDILASASTKAGG